MVPALLRGRVFRRYWSASAISMFGDQVSGVGLPLAAVLGAFRHPMIRAARRGLSRRGWRDG